MYKTRNNLIINNTMAAADAFVKCSILINT